MDGPEAARSVVGPMTTSDLLERARDAFRQDLATPPPLTLRGGNAVDSYDRPEAFDPALDEPTDAYLEQYAFWGLVYLDARSWRHYLPRLMEYALTHPEDPRMVAEALVRSLRPPDRYPPRLAALSSAQEAVVTAFLERLSSQLTPGPLAGDARQALVEWWGPDPTSRPTADAVEAARRSPATYARRNAEAFTLDLPVTLAGGDMRELPGESRRVAAWSGTLCSDAHTIVTVNIWPLKVRPMAEAIDRLATYFRAPLSPRTAAVRGADVAQRFDGLVDGDSPAEPRHLTLVLAERAPELFVLSIRTWPRDDVLKEVERIASSFEVAPPVRGPGSVKNG